MSKKKLYTRDELGGIKFNSGRKPGEVRIPNYVYDMWLPLIGTEAITVYAVYCRLERAEIVTAITMDTIARCCRMSKTTLGKLNDVLVECGFITIKKPEGNRRAHHMTNEITVNDPPQKISAELIAKYQPASGYEPLSKWLCEVPDSTSHEVPDSTSRSTTQYHDEVLPSTSTMLQPSILQPSSIALKDSALDSADVPEPPLELIDPKSTPIEASQPDASANPPPPVPPAPPSEAEGITGLIKAWLDTADVAQPTAYGNKTIRGQGLILHQRGVSPEHVKAYIAFLRRDGFWKDKAIQFKTIANGIIPWLISKGVLKKPNLEPTPPPSNGEYIVPLSPAQLREKDAREKAEREKAS